MIFYGMMKLNVLGRYDAGTRLRGQTEIYDEAGRLIHVQPWQQDDGPYPEHVAEILRGIGHDVTFRDLTFEESQHLAPEQWPRGET